VGAFDGLTAVVTGGAQGIGRASVERLAAEGASVVVADVQAGLGFELASRVRGRYVECDVTERDAWDRLAREVGPIDLLHLNAGVATGERDICRVSMAQFGRAMAINVDGMAVGMFTVLPGMLERGRGSIVVTSSVAALVPFPADPVYAMTKSAILGLVRSAAAQVQGHGVTINSICPDAFYTQQVGTEAKMTLESGGAPLFQPAEVGAAVVDVLASGRTGETWVLRANRPAQVYEFPPPPA
jgi:NAD(P)-dependent dehydrogenase (short-subunit alcohol dehydrogenase family)